MPTIDSAATESAIVSKRVRRMFGLALDTWNTLTVVFLGIAAAAAIALVISQWVVNRLQKEETRIAAEAFEKYKTGVAAEVAAAHERAAVSERDAAEARLETERLRAEFAWRTIGHDAEVTLVTHLRAKPSEVNIEYVTGNPEAQYFAIGLGVVFKMAKWKVALRSAERPKVMLFGLIIPPPPPKARDGAAADIELLRSAFSAAGVAVSVNPLPPSDMAVLTEDDFEGAAEVIVGSKPPPRQ